MNNIFAPFDNVSLSEWLKQIEKDLKGKPLSELNSNPESDLLIKAYHHAENTVEAIDNSLGRQAQRKDNSWKIRQVFSAENPIKSNAAILHALNNGVDALSMNLSNGDHWPVLSKGILFEHINADIKLDKPFAVQDLEIGAETKLNFDFISLNARKGSMTYAASEFVQFYKNNPKNAAVWIEGKCYGEAGASTIQELAFTLNHLNEYLHILVSEGISLEEINDKIVLELSVNDNYFVNIVKFRVIHELMQMVFQAYDENYQLRPVTVYATTNLRHHSKNDHHNNLLRSTTQAMSAVIGGCDVLTIQNDTSELTEDHAFQNRMARNIQLILKEEAYLSHVNDAGGGAYYIENLGEQMLSKAWELFQQVEFSQGLLANLKANAIQELIRRNKEHLIKDLNEEKHTFLGVNKYQNGTEEWINESEPATNTSTDFIPLTPFRLAAHYKKA
jgi:methylmalonyl-CoA mutase